MFSCSSYWNGSIIGRISFNGSFLLKDHSYYWIYIEMERLNVSKIRLLIIYMDELIIFRICNNFSAHQDTLRQCSIHFMLICWNEKLYQCELSVRKKVFCLSSTCFTVERLMKVIRLRIRGMKTIRITDGGMFLCQSFVPDWTGWQVCQDEIESYIEHFNIPPEWVILKTPMLPFHVYQTSNVK